MYDSLKLETLLSFSNFKYIILRYFLFVIVGYISPWKYLSTGGHMVLIKQ